jgi:hypothetical protein
MERPTQIKIPLTDYNKLMELVVWLEAMPECAEEVVGDRFATYMQEEQLDLIGFEDETDTFCVPYAVVNEGKLYAFMIDNTTEEDYLIPVVADADLA